MPTTSRDIIERSIEPTAPTSDISGTRQETRIGLNEAQDARKNVAWLNAIGALFGGGHRPELVEGAYQSKIGEFQLKQKQAQQQQQRQLAQQQQAAASDRQQRMDALKFAGERRAQTTFGQQQEDRTGATQRAEELRDPASPASQQWRAGLVQTNPEMTKALQAAGVFDTLTAEKVQSPAFQTQLAHYNRLGYFRATDESMQRRSALEGGATPGQMRAMATPTGEAGVSRTEGGKEIFEDELEGLRAPVRALFPPDWLKSTEEGRNVGRSINGLTGNDFRRGSLYGKKLQMITTAAKRAEEEQSFVVPGWERTQSLGFPEISTAESKQAREAAAAHASLKASVQRLGVIHKELLDSPFETAASLVQNQWVSNAMAEALGEQESVMSNIRVINQYGAPQAHEMVRLEDFMPRFSTVKGLLSGPQRYGGLMKAANKRIDAGMRSKGYERRRAPRPR